MPHRGAREGPPDADRRHPLRLLLLRPLGPKGERGAARPGSAAHRPTPHQRRRRRAAGLGGGECAPPLLRAAVSPSSAKSKAGSKRTGSSAGARSAKPILAPADKLKHEIQAVLTDELAQDRYRSGFGRFDGFAYAA